MNNLVENIDFKFVHPEDVPEKTCIEILEGKYKGVVFSFDNVKLPELKEDQSIEPDEEVVVQFNFDIHEYNSHNEDELREDLEFQKNLGGILQRVLELAVERMMADYESRPN